MLSVQQPPTLLFLKSIMDDTELKQFLDCQAARFDNPDFISEDPISVPHRFSRPDDIAIAGFLAATIAWGQRKSIVKSAHTLINWMDGSPHDFIVNCTAADLLPFEKFVYRTFNGTDCVTFLRSLHNIYINHGGLENVVTEGFKSTGSIRGALTHLFQVFFEIDHQHRTEKHLANPDRGSASKRTNMYLRWMVRQSGTGVDFGIWRNIPQSALQIPLDVHVGNVSRQLGLLTRRQNDWQAVEELTARLRQFCPDDPVKYDFALFSLGVNNLGIRS